MSWDEYVCLGKADGCEGYRGAPCDCCEPYYWTDEEKAESKALLDELLLEDWKTGRLVVRGCDACNDELADRFAHQDETRAAVIDEILRDLPRLEF